MNWIVYDFVYDTSLNRRIERYLKLSFNILCSSHCALQIIHLSMSPQKLEALRICSTEIQQVYIHVKVKHREASFTAHATFLGVLHNLILIHIKQVVTNEVSHQF